MSLVPVLRSFVSLEGALIEFDYQLLDDAVEAGGLGNHIILVLRVSVFVVGYLDARRPGSVNSIDGVAGCSTGWPLPLPPCWEVWRLPVTPLPGGWCGGLLAGGDHWAGQAMSSRRPH